MSDEEFNFLVSIGSVIFLVVCVVVYFLWRLHCDRVPILVKEMFKTDTKYSQVSTADDVELTGANINGLTKNALMVEDDTLDIDDIDSGR